MYRKSIKSSYTMSRSQISMAGSMEPTAIKFPTIIQELVYMRSYNFIEEREGVKEDIVK